MLVATRDDFAYALSRLQALTGPLVIDTETSGLEMFARENPARMVGIAIGDAERPGNDFYFTFRHGEGENLPLELLEPLRELVKHRTWYGHNLAFDVKILLHDGFQMPGHIRDTIIASHLCDENEPSFALKELGRKYISETAADADEELKKELRARKLGKGDMWRLPATMVAPYALQDINLTRQLYAKFAPELNRWGLTKLYAEVNEFSLALTRMEMRGLQLDVEETQRQADRVWPTIERVKMRIRFLAGYDINLNSPKQLREWLRLPETDQKALQEAIDRDQREDCKLVLEYRAAHKAKRTYFDPYMARMTAAGRVHFNYKVTGTVTGRLSGNGQQMSRDQSGRGYSVRSCFTAKPGHFLIEGDFSAVEPRIAAHYSGDKVMQQAFFEGKDFHTAVARSMFKKDNISKEERTSAKTVGLGTLYGMGAHKAARKLGLRHEKDPTTGKFLPHHVDVWAFHNDQLVQVPCHVADAEFCTHAGKEFRAKFYEGVPELQPFLRTVVDKATQHRYVRNPISGRVRRFTGPRAKPFSAPNSLIQSTAADILRRALVALDRLFTEPHHPQMVLTVHDSIVFEVPFGPSAMEYLQTIKQVMENTTKLSVPLVVDFKIGPSLGNMAEIRL